MNTLTVANPLEALLPMVLDAMPSPTSRISYAHALRDFLRFCASTGSVMAKTTVNAYRAELEARALAPSTINVRLAAVRRLAVEAGDNGLLDPHIAAAISRVRGIKTAGVRAGNWLTLDQCASLLAAPDASLTGLRDRAILGILIGCGLRRSELVALTTANLQQREGRWVLIDIQGKGRRIRSVAVPAWAYDLIAAWLSAAQIHEGLLFRSVKRGIVGSRLSTQAIYDTVDTYSKQIGVTVAPHDLRRTYARLCRSAGGALEQLQYSLGHASITTTAKYLGHQQDLVNAPGDLIAL